MLITPDELTLYFQPFHFPVNTQPDNLCWRITQFLNLLFQFFHLLFNLGRQLITVLHFAAADNQRRIRIAQADHIEGAVLGYITGETQDGFVDIIVRHDYIKSFLV
ncbi:hypothetical protein A7T54_08750 [Salmonella enterica subsp. enterica serovar Saintpaul]|nr:hypothetical protein IN93_11990 [Salmonella enterica]OHG84450.1 hypothetical protein A7T50_02870 [Salmonella enterica subsp. enterica serovar Saintpaul]OHL46183.1 hypothetical protein A7S99_05105 [Salmonella enterica subsp. enterica serovar Rubislaw]OHG88065.1 hypothetical protein A7T54_08750 [Salmonella enterica subsp. enterica serovar Saintpaul]OHJ40111.1 hypothetical protein A7S48_05185 [Salmonella enterica subsp. enterica serovar Saintpaul]